MRRIRQLSLIKKRKKNVEDTEILNGNGKKPNFLSYFSGPIVGLFVGYGAAFLWSPDQVYDLIYRSGTNDFSGTWSGYFQGREARLNLSYVDASGQREMTGTMKIIFENNPKELPVNVSLDGSLSMTADWNTEDNLLVGFDIVRGSRRSFDEMFLELKTSENSALFCSKIDNKCRQIGGYTYFSKN